MVKFKGFVVYGEWREWWDGDDWLAAAYYI